MNLWISQKKKCWVLEQLSNYERLKNSTPWNSLVDWLKVLSTGILLICDVFPPSILICPQNRAGQVLALPHSLKNDYGHRKHVMNKLQEVFSFNPNFFSALNSHFVWYTTSAKEHCEHGLVHTNLQRDSYSSVIRVLFPLAAFVTD
jgi:hypothetical protein